MGGAGAEAMTLRPRVEPNRVPSLSSQKERRKLEQTSPIMLLTSTLLREGAFREGTFEGRSRGGARARSYALRSRADLGL